MSKIQFSKPKFDNELWNLTIGQRTFHQSSGLDEDRKLWHCIKEKSTVQERWEGFGNFTIHNQIQGCHYEVGLLWKENAKLPNNRWLAEKQLKNLKAKLSTKPVLWDKIWRDFPKQLAKRICCKNWSLYRQHKVSFLSTSSSGVERE